MAFSERRILGRPDILFKRDSVESPVSPHVLIVAKKEDIVGGSEDTNIIHLAKRGAVTRAAVHEILERFPHLKRIQTAPAFINNFTESARRQIAEKGVELSVARVREGTELSRRIHKLKRSNPGLFEELMRKDYVGFIVLTDLFRLQRGKRVERKRLTLGELKSKPGISDEIIERVKNRALKFLGLEPE